MELIFNILKQLAASLSTTEFLLVLALISVTSFTLLKFIVQHSKKKGGILSAFFGGDDASEKSDALNKQLTELSTQHITDTLRIISAIEKLSDEAKVRSEHYKDMFTDVSNLRKEFVASIAQLLREVEDINYQFKTHYQYDQQANESIKEVVRRVTESVERIFIVLEKSEEFIRNTVPEFRTYHKDLSKELSNLERDVTLIERGIQTQINNNNAVKLR